MLCIFNVARRDTFVPVVLTFFFSSGNVETAFEFVGRFAPFYVESLSFFMWATNPTGI